ncbi:hypothetical protein VKT23_003612 [Stygiomarasmius scandens]|uniref:Uncharacterized protein n=1 Tax=Marasmiellus scandens TaxID=2682957 RepID=A0ABR1K0I9_9AGAR
MVQRAATLVDPLQYSSCSMLLEKRTRLLFVLCGCASIFCTSPYAVQLSFLLGCLLVLPGCSHALFIVSCIHLLHSVIFNFSICPCTHPHLMRIYTMLCDSFSACLLESPTFSTSSNVFTFLADIFSQHFDVHNVLSRSRTFHEPTYVMSCCVKTS